MHTIRPVEPIRRTRAGFTLVELLVVIAIIGILISLLLPASANIRDGRFSVLVTAGEKIVRITASRETGRMIQGAMDQHLE